MKTVMVLEDSRKVGFGGGQKGSLETIAALHGHVHLLATDSVEDSLFATKVRQWIPQGVLRLYSYGRGASGHQASFSISLMELLLYPCLTLLNTLRLLQVIRKQGLHASNCIVYAPLKKTLVLAWIIHVLKGIPFIYHSRNFDNPNSLFFKPLMWILKRAQLILCVSKSVQKNLNLPNCTLLMNAIQSPENMTPRTIRGKRPIVIAAFASLIPWKGLEFLIQAAHLIQDPSAIEVRIYGSGPLQNTLAKQCHANTQLYGFTQEVNRLLQQEIDLICVPSISEEAFGRVPVEGYAFGIPAIVTNIGAQAEITLHGQTGFCVPIENAKAIAQAIEQLIQNPDLYESMSQNALQHVKKFSMGAFNQRIQEIFSAV